MLKKTLFLGGLMLLLFGCDGEKLFSTPENTIKSYYTSLKTGNGDLMKKCFINPQHSFALSEGYEVDFTIKHKKLLTVLDVIEFEEQIKKNDADFKRRNPDSTYSMYQEFLRDRDTYKQAGDVEIVITVKVKDGSYEDTAFLRNINGEWKLIDEPRGVVH
jgi:hypothetical protein